MTTVRGGTWTCQGYVSLICWSVIQFLRLAADGPEGDPGKPLQRETGRLPRQLADFEVQGAAWSRAALLGYNGGVEDKL